MPECRHYAICGLDDKADPGAGLCILHSEDAKKDKQAFAAALEEHRKKNGDKFALVVFPGDAHFSGATFTKEATFSGATFTETASFLDATFSEGADFGGATFTKEAHFGRATFTKEATFSGATFTETASFLDATFSEGADFGGVTFTKGAHFGGVTFTKRADFYEATFGEWAQFRMATFTEQARFRSAKFNEGVFFGEAMFSGQANFRDATFTGQADFSLARFIDGAYFDWATFTENTDFSWTTFSGGAFFRETVFKGERVNFSFSFFQRRAVFTSQRRSAPIFRGVELDFREVLIDSPDTFSFRDADLKKCRFLDTDLRKIEMTGVKWTQGRSGSEVYDEIAPLETDAGRPWERIERLYRELKQNHEDRRDYERAGDFHYGEKEMRRRNPTSSFAL